MIQVFSIEDKDILTSKGMNFICEQKIGDITTYIFEFNNKLKFNLSDIKYRVCNKLYF